MDEDSITTDGKSEPNQVSPITLTSDDVLKAWNDYADLIQKEKPAHFSLMQVYKPVLTGNSRITVRFEGQIQVELFNEIKKDLIFYLKKTLSTINLEITDEVVESIEDNGKPRLYTPDEKFRFMAERNPALLRFRQQLNLDLD